MNANRAAYQAFCDALNGLKPGWEITEDGLTGPERARVRLGQQHASGNDGHVDVQFVFNDRASTKSELWDCVSGFGETALEQVQTAAQFWANTTAPALLEFKYSHRGEFADHYRGDDPSGFTGWHVICGGILGVGHDDSPGKLQNWRVPRRSVNRFGEPRLAQDPTRCVRALLCPGSPPRDAATMNYFLEIRFTLKAEGPCL